MSAIDAYRDIIGLPHHVSAKHPHMSLYDRAAQFAPFAARTGYGDAVSEAARLTEEAPELSEAAAGALDRKLAYLLDKAEEQPEVELTLFVPDERKAGGAYETRVVRVRRIDAALRRLETTARESIPLDDIVGMDGDFFAGMAED